ncbi:MAG: hypothetical protein K8S16_12790 [Bacteroidales bacterium]|nr:hypothetical protein [Bacteroidales bacterium]
MQGDRSCIMLNELQGINTVFNAASSASQVCFPADDIPVTENEVYMVNNQPILYYHGEFDFHMYSSTIGYDPDGNNLYNSLPFSDADLNSDNFISVKEASLWEIDKKAVLLRI